jgi:hypothetical protein
MYIYCSAIKSSPMLQMNIRPPPFWIFESSILNKININLKTTPLIMKKSILFISLLILLMNCQFDDQPELSKSLTFDIETKAAFRMSATFPDQIFIPDGFSPEGIVSGNGTEFFVGSLLAGAIYKGDFRTGEGFILVPQLEGRAAVGLDYDERTDFLYVAGAYGVAYVYNATSGLEIAEIQLTTKTFPATLINDCIVTGEAVYFTDSFQPVFFRIPLMNNGQLPDPILVETIPLSSDFVFVMGGINANGIVASNSGKELIIGNLGTGLIYLVNPLTGQAHEIDLGGEILSSVDGLVLEGNTLYGVQNNLNQIGVVELTPDFTSGEIVRTIVHPEYKIPATATIFGNRIYAVNARFDVAPPPLPGSPLPDPTIRYDVIGVDKN